MNAVSSGSPASSPSKSDAAPLRRWLGWLRLAAGPLALAGFFLPWAHGPGAFAATEFTGFTLVGFAGRLQALDLSVLQGGVLWAARLVILGVAIAGTWQTLLAPGHRTHFAYPVSGWYLAVAAGVLSFAGLARSGLELPPLGLALVVAGGVCFLASTIGARESRKTLSRDALRIEDGRHISEHT